MNFLKNIFFINESKTKYYFLVIIIRGLIITGLLYYLFLLDILVDKKHVNKVVEDIFVEGMSKLEIKTEIYKRLNKELKGEDRIHLKTLEYEIQQLEDDEIEFTDYIVEGTNEYDSNTNLIDHDEENLGCQSGDDDGRELNFD